MYINTVSTNNLYLTFYQDTNMMVSTMSLLGERGPSNTII